MTSAPGLADAATIARMRRVARILDSAFGIPGTSIRFGLDPIIGLVPGLGDAAGAVLAAWIVLLAARVGAPTSVVLRMLTNVAVDAVAGAIPFLGDLFDMGWKANTRNLDLLERYFTAPREVHAASRAMVAGILVVLAGLVAGGTILGFLAIKWLLSRA
jgi:hypothetical protein